METKSSDTNNSDGKASLKRQKSLESTTDTQDVLHAQGQRGNSYKISP